MGMVNKPDDRFNISVKPLVQLEAEHQRYEGFVHSDYRLSAADERLESHGQYEFNDTVSLKLIDHTADDLVDLANTDCYLIVVAFAAMSMDIEVGGCLENVTLAPGNAIGGRGDAVHIRSVKGGDFLVLEVCSDLARNLASSVSREALNSASAKELYHFSCHHTGSAYLVRRLLSSSSSTCKETMHAAGILILTEFFQGARKQKKPQAALSQELIAKLDKAINAGIDDAITIDDLAEYCDLPVSKFSKLFKAATGLPPYQYVLQRRIEIAQRWLQETNMAISEVAYACGFSSQAHMTSTFSRALGITPKQCRSRAQ